MLAALRGTAAHASISGGLDQLRVRRYGIAPDTGAPGGDLERAVWLNNPTLGYFVGGSFYFDPLAIGVGLYDLSSQFRVASKPPLRFHLAPDPDPGCVLLGEDDCPPNGGAVSLRQDLTIALAWNLGNVQLGAGVHFPRIRERFAFDNDTELTPAPDDVDTVRCTDKESPQCAERVGFKGWTKWLPGDEGPPGFDAALTFGVAVELRNETITLGARYRTFPLRRGGDVVLGGVGLVCRPEASVLESEDIVPGCAVAEPVNATLRQRIPQEVALGGSFVLGRSRLWRLDTNFYWIDLCPGGATAADCPNERSQKLRLVGLDRQRFVLPEFDRHRGLQDVYGIDAQGSYGVRSHIRVLFAGHMSSPSVRRGAQTAAYGEGWKLGMTLGAQFRIRQTGFILRPAYGLDVALPRDVTPAKARFRPQDATTFEQSGGDLNAPGAPAVLEGRARPTNAGRYFGLVHTFSFGVSWGETPAVLD